VLDGRSWFLVVVFIPDHSSSIESDSEKSWDLWNVLNSYGSKCVIRVDSIGPPNRCIAEDAWTGIIGIEKPPR
jgi:hypothetical protein